MSDKNIMRIERFMRSFDPDVTGVRRLPNGSVIVDYSGGASREGHVEGYLRAMKNWLGYDR